MRGLLNTAVALLLTLSHTAQAHSVKRNPLGYLTRVETPILHTASNRVHSNSKFELTFFLHKTDKIRISLEPNHDVISDDTHVNYLNSDGKIHRSERITRTDHKVYKGSAFVLHEGHKEWLNAGWARVIVLRDGPNPIFEGSFHLNGDSHHVQTSANFRRTQHHEDPVVEFAEDEYMVVWRDSDIIADDERLELKRGIEERSTCSSDDLEYNMNDDHPIYRARDVTVAAANSRDLLLGRQIDGTAGGGGPGVNLQNSIGSTAGCPVTRKIALVGIANDCSYRADFESEQAMRSNIISMVNTASQLYESSFNITLGIANLTINGPDCPGTAPATAPWNIPCNRNLKLSERLNMFSNWRGLSNDRNAYWTLLTKCAEEAGAVGIAWLGELCSKTAGDGNGTANGANVVARIASSEWQIFAHETGHTFGAVHDCTSTTCADGTVTQQKCCPVAKDSCDARGRFIMNPSASGSITQFSPCTIGNICSAISRKSVNDNCLSSNRDVPTFTGSQCGNGIVESGEDCDCGGANGCGNNPCCDATTCKFKTNAVCDPTNEECCTQQCRFASSGTVCRASTGSCDPQETCSGTSGMCPSDTTAPDGQSCGDGLNCASGQCTSRDLQCRSIVGVSANSTDTTSCDPNTCVVACNSPRLGTARCYNLGQNFLSGTPCGSGKCNNGRCEGSNFLEDAKSWIEQNKHIVIPVASVVGGLILIAIASCLWSCIRRRRSRSKAPPPPPPSWQGAGGGGAWAAANVSRPPPAAARGPGGGGRGAPRGAPQGPYQSPDQQYSAYRESQQWGVRRVNTASRYA